MGGTRPADRPASAGRWSREASTDHSHEDGERAVDAVLFTVQDPRTTRHRRVPTTHGPATAPENCETRACHHGHRTRTCAVTAAGYPNSDSALCSASSSVGLQTSGRRHHRPTVPLGSETEETASPHDRID